MGQKYLTSPVPSQGMPNGIPYIIGNEFAERFSFYGMKAILMIFMTEHLLDRAGNPDTMNDADAKFWFHQFSSLVYLTPILGALIADIFFGKYRTIIVLSIVYCLGHLALAFDSTRLGLAVGLSLIALGAGGIKPCVSAHVGDQFGKTNQHLMPKIFGWFYFSINAGAGTSMLLTPVLLSKLGAHVAFAIPGVLMLLATIFFWMGRHKFIHIPAGGRVFVRETLSREGLLAMAKLSVLFAFVAMFWALFDQTSSAWVLQAKEMNRDVVLGDRVIWSIMPSQMQAANPFLIMGMIPLFSYVIYPQVDKVFRMTAMRKIAIGLFITIPAFALPAWLEQRIQAGAPPHIAWQFVAYVLMTAAEIMISITCLEFAYTQAPKAMKSFIMSLFLASVALGNQFTALVNLFIQNPDGSSKLEGASYYWFFTGCITVTAFLFLIVARFYKEKAYIHAEGNDKPPPEDPGRESPLDDDTGNPYQHFSE